MSSLVRSLLVCCAVVGLLVPARPHRAEARSQPPLRTERGVVAADSSFASEAGAEVLAAGGSAADAVVAVTAMLGVTHPFASGLGGGGFCLYYDVATRDVSVYDFREVAPAAASSTMYLDADGNPQPSLSLTGGLAVGVPGTVAGLSRLHADHGARPWASNFTAAIALARHGQPASDLLVKRIERYKDTIAEDPEFAAWLMPSGDLPAPGDLLVNTALADLMERVADEGPDAFYQGELAEALVTELAAAQGIVTLDDLASYEVVMREPVTGSYRGYQIVSMPPPSSGGIALIETLNILEGFDVPALGFGSSAYLHHLAEALKFAFADRANFVGDPAFVEVPTSRLTSNEYADSLRAQIQGDAVLATDAYGPLRYVPDDDGTSHFAVVDAAGNAASCTVTVNTSFGSKVFIGPLGLVLNNEMDDFVQKPGVANTYGLVGTEANAVAAGKRPLSSMTPTLLFDGEGNLFMAVGASGGPTIITATIQAILAVVDFEMDVREAVEATRIHHQWLPNKLFVEPDVARDVVTNLEARGQEVTTRDGFSAVQLVVVRDSVRTAASDPRKHGQPAAEPAPRKAR